MYDPERWKSLVREGRFTEAADLAVNLSPQRLEDELVEVAFDTGSFAPYEVAAELIKRNETAVYHYIASVILATALSHLDNAYEMAYAHARRSVELAPSEHSYQEYLLFFYQIPDQLLPEDEAKQIARDLLLKDPENEAAREILG